MAGRPKLNAYSESIETLGGEDFVLEQLFELGSFAAVARSLGMSSAMFYWWIHDTPERATKFTVARELIGLAKCDEVESMMAEDPDINPLTGAIDSGWVTHQNNRVKAVIWLAGRYNRTLRDSASTEVKVNVQNVLSDLMENIKARGNQRLVGGQGSTIDGVVSRPLLPAGDDA